jgi:NAD(P)-dependent dehydrogenase (short-subunit alcohol dehydrogenase family)
MSHEPQAGRLAGRRAFITGASQGLGAATARCFIREGASVALIARRAGPLEALAAELGPSAIAIAADVTEPEQVERAVAAAISRLGGLDIVVNSAGIGVPMSIEDTTPDRWQATLDVNLSGSFYVARAAARHMLEHRGGAIVNVGSEFSVLAGAHYVAYCASKSGVIGLTKALAAELAPTINVNAVLPGVMDTPMLHDALAASGDYDGMYKKMVADRVPLGRLATPDEIAAGILYFAAEGTFATGAILALDGGTTF